MAKKKARKQAASPTDTDNPQLPVYKGRKKVYYERLVELYEALAEEIRTLSDSSLTFERQAGEELADIGSESFLREMELGLMGEEGKKIILVQEALKRLARGKYGVCLDCSAKINDGRLEALPYAKLCIDCKSKREQQEAEGIFVESEEVTE